MTTTNIDSSELSGHFKQCHRQFLEFCTSEPSFFVSDCTRIANLDEELQDFTVHQTKKLINREKLLSKRQMQSHDKIDTLTVQGSREWWGNDFKIMVGKNNSMLNTYYSCAVIAMLMRHSATVAVNWMQHGKHTTM